MPITHNKPMAQFPISNLAPAGVLLLGSTLGYGSQILFRYLESGALEPAQSLIFNLLFASAWISYARTCCTDPGRVPANWASEDELCGKSEARRRWCGKCEAAKPARAHHCRTCQRWVCSHGLMVDYQAWYLLFLEWF